MMEKDLIGNASSGENATAESPFLDHSAIAQGFKCAAYIIVVAFSILGNCLVVAAFKLNINGKLRTVNSMFIVSMAAGDLLLTLGSTPERITRILVSEQWIIGGHLGIVLCKTTNYLEKLCMNVSIIHLAMVAIDRFLVVFYPRRKIITVARARQIIIMAWLASAVYCVPLFYYANLLEENGSLLCKTRRFFTNWRIWYLVFLSLLVLTLLLVVVLYAAIAIRLCRGRAPKPRTRLNSRVLKMVAMIVFAFYCCFLPYWIGWVFCSYYRSNVICNDTYVFVAIFLLYANSAVNPVIYSFFNYNFRDSFCFILNKFCNCSFTSRDSSLSETYDAKKTSEQRCKDLKLFTGNSRNQDNQRCSAV